MLCAVLVGSANPSKNSYFMSCVCYDTKYKSSTSSVSAMKWCDTTGAKCGTSETQRTTPVAHRSKILLLLSATD